MAVATTTALAVASIGATVAGGVMQYNAAKDAEAAQKAQAKWELANTERRVSEEQDRASQNILRAQEEKRKALAKQRAAFVSSGVLPDSPSAQFLIGELGDNLQTRIQDMFVGHQDRIHSISSQGVANHFNAIQNAKASSRRASGALIGTIGSVATQGFRGSQSGLFERNKQTGIIGG